MRLSSILFAIVLGATVADARDEQAPFDASVRKGKGHKGHDHLKPDYEVKALLKPDMVLGPDHKLTSTVLSAFDMGPDVRKLHVQYIDTDDKELYDHLWSPRIRKPEGEDEWDLTYKKRYPIKDGPDGIEAVLKQAAKDGFAAKDDNYEAQIEWGYAKFTLSLSLKKSVKNKGHKKMELPGLRHSRKLLIREAPGKFDDWESKGWGCDTLSKSRIYGPVYSRRSSGFFGKDEDGKPLELDIDVWPIRGPEGKGKQYLVEASFKTDSREHAESKQKDLVAFLEEKGWFVPEDALKTQLIMDRY